MMTKETCEKCREYDSEHTCTGRQEPHVCPYSGEIDGVREYEGRIVELEVKLAKAVEFIEDLTGCEWPYCEDAKRVLTELKGQDNE